MKLGPEDPVEWLAVRWLQEQLDALQHQKPHVLADVDPEGVHQMRVASRRMRALLRVCKDLPACEKLQRQKADLKWLASQLGAVRDLDVELASLGSAGDAMPAEYASGYTCYQQHLQRERQTALQELRLSVNGPRYAELTQGLADFVNSYRQQEHRGESTIRDAAQAWINKQYRRVLRDGRTIQHDSADARLHALRIDCKRLRYLFEFFRPVYGASLKNAIRELKVLQNVLGEVQDSHVAMQRLLDHAEVQSPTSNSRFTLMALGHLYCLQGQRLSRARSQFFQIWPGFDQQGRRKRLLARLREERS